MPTEIEKLEEQIEKIKDQMDELEENCDELDICKEDDGCKRCETHKKIIGLADEIEALEDKLEELVSADEVDDDDD